MNPVLVKELRSLLRERRGWMVPMAYALLLAGCVALFLVPQLWSAGVGSVAVTGTYLVGMVAVVQTGMLLVFAPLVGAASIAGERERTTWLSLLASPVPRRQIALGKVLVSCLYVLVLLAVSLPVAALGLVLGAIDVPALAGLYLTHALLGLTLACLGVATSSAFQRTWTAALVAIGLTLAGAVFTAALAASVAATLEMAQFQDPAWMYEWIWYFNPGYGLYLFFAGDADTGSPSLWLGHYGAMLAVGGVAVAATVARLRRMQA